MTDGFDSGHCCSVMLSTVALHSCILSFMQRMPLLEDRLRAEVGPEFGFDLSKIALHYQHRMRVRQALPSLQLGKLVLLTAKHRYGPHGHVFAFARVLHGELHTHTLSTHSC